MSQASSLKEPKTCEACGAIVAELRRGRCWGCYTRWTDNRPVGLGAACTMCNDRRRENLRSVELLRAWVPICHNCAARAMKLVPMPSSIDEIRKRLHRDRRRTDRRAGRKDTRVFQRERRGLERRNTGLARGDDLMLLDDEDIVVIDSDGDADRGEETRIVIKE
jgi:hypothetical protein